MWKKQDGGYLYLFKPGDGPKLPPNMVLTCFDGRTKLAKDINWESEETRYGFTAWGFLSPTLLKYARKKGYPVPLSYVANPSGNPSGNPFAD
jgi:hypothetical protein